MTSPSAEEGEARAFGRYLLGRDPAPELVARYAAACAAHFAAERDVRELSVVAFARSHPRLIGPLDGAAGLLRPRSLLRKKILLMAAVLEATPEHAHEFLPRTSSALLLFPRLALLGLSAAAKALAGVLLLALVERRALGR